MTGHAFTASTVMAKTSAASGRITATQATLRQPVSSLRRAKSATRRGSGGLPTGSACGVAGTLPATPPTVAIT